MNFKKLFEDCNLQSVLYKKLGRLWEQKHEEDCMTAIGEVISIATKDIEKICKNGYSPCRICSKRNRCNRPIADYCKEFEWKGVNF